MYQGNRTKKADLGYCISDVETHNIVGGASFLNGYDKRLKWMKYVCYQSSGLWEGVL